MRSNLTKVLAVGLVSAFCGVSSSARAAETVLKAITYAPLSKVEDSMVIFKKWVDKVNTAGKGEIRVELLGGPEVFPVSDQMNALSKGLVDAVMTFSVHTPIVPEVIRPDCPISRRPKSGATVILPCSTKPTRRST